MLSAERTSRQWFEEAVRCYEEHHQGCPWCGGTHRVYHIHHGDLECFSCQTCEFEVFHDTATGEFRHIVGEILQEQPDTMFAV